MGKWKIPVGSVPMGCIGCLASKGWDVYKAVTDADKHYLHWCRCRNCGTVFPFFPRIEEEIPSSSLKETSE